MDNEGVNRNDSALDDVWSQEMRGGQGQTQRQLDALEAARQSEEDSLVRGEEHNEDVAAKNNVEKARDAEGFKNSVVGNKGQDKSAKLKGLGKFGATKKGLKKYGPVGAALGMMMTVMAIFGVVTGGGLTSFVENGMNINNTQRISMSKRFGFLSKRMLGDGRAYIAKKGGIFSREKFKISDEMAKNLKKQGINYLEIEGNDGKKLRVLHFKDEGKDLVVAASKKDVNRIPDKIQIEGTEIKPSNKEIFGKMKADNSINKNFGKGLREATVLMRGHVAGWFDSVAEILFKKLKTSRNRFKDAKETDSDEQIKESAKREGLNTEVDESGLDRKAGGEDENGKISETVDPKDGQSDGLSKGMNEEGVSKSLSARAKAAAAAVGGSQVLCAAMQSVNAISLTVGAMQMAQTLKFATGFLESVHRMKAGDGGRPMNFYMNNMTKKGPTKVFKDGKTIDLRSKPTSSMESPAFNQYFSDGKLTLGSNDLGVQKFNREQVMKNALSSKGFAGGLVKFAGEAGVAAMSSIAAYKACIGSGVASSLASLTNPFAGALFNGLITFVVGSVIQVTVPMVAKFLAMDLIENMAGEDAAYALNSGFHSVTNKNFQLASGRPGTKAEVLAQWRQNQEILAQDAKFERAKSSPFDWNNQHTFLGSLTRQILPAGMAIWNSPSRFLSLVPQMTSNSLATLMPGVGAVASESNFRGSLNENCPSLNELGLVGDAFCNAYIISDQSTVNVDPADVFERVDKDDKDNFGDDESDNPQVQEDSSLAKWIVSCAMRESNFGNIDTNLAFKGDGDDADSTSMDAATSMTLDATPVLGELKGIYEGYLQAKNVGWSTGQNCSDPKYKYYSRYSEDQRLMEAMGLIDESAVTAFMEKHEQKHPTDNSYEGVIARYSGLPKQEVENVLGLIEYHNYVAEYRAKKRTESQARETELKLKQKTNHFEDKFGIMAVTVRKVIFNDVRNRTKVA